MSLSGEAPAATSIVERLSGTTVLITGGTGLVGKALVEKILRSVPSVERMYLLVRARREDECPEHRAAVEIRDSPIFGMMDGARSRQIESLWKDKVRIVSGDLATERLGLSDQAYRELSDRVDLVINAAASVNFNERLDRAIAVNVDGPVRVLELARSAGAALLHISTCYVAGRRGGDIPETLAGPPSGNGRDSEELLDEARRLCTGAASATSGSSRRTLRAAGAAFADEHGWCDVYGITKWFAEHALARAASGLPLTIIRPSIIESSLREPVAGWIDRVRLIDPMILEYGRGRLRDFPADEDAVLDIIPLDLVVNAIIVALADAARTETMTIYQIGSSARNPLYMRQFARAGYEFFSDRPMFDSNDQPISVLPFDFSGPLEAPRAAIHGSETVRNPARPMSRRQLALAHTLSGYANVECRFLDSELRALADGVTAHDRAAFPCCVESIDWPEYLATHISAIVGRG